MSDKIKTVLLSMKSVDETALMTLDVGVEPCLFVTNVVTKCLKLNQPVTHYQRLDSAITEIYQALVTWLETVSGNVQLIVPKIDQAYESDQHEMIEHRSVKGRANRILEIKLPGLRCNDAVQLKAQVVSS